MTTWHESVEAVILDSGGVLLLPDPCAIRSAMETFEAPLPDDETCRRGHYTLTREIDRVMSSLHPPSEPDPPENWLALAGFFQVASYQQDQAAAALREAYNQHPWVPAPGAAEALLLLVAAGFSLAVVSNAYGTMEQLLADYGICAVVGEGARVAIVVDSHIVGVAKPDPAIFEIALAAVHKDPASCLYVGDTVYFDVDGARGAGLRAVHLDPPRLCLAEDHAHVDSLDALVQRLGIREASADTL